MDSESSKKIILSILAVLILIVSVVGISFAVFTYASRGEVINTISTGSIVFDFVDGDAINLTNHFPIDKEAGKNLSGSNNVCTFSIKASVSAGELKYYIYAVPGDVIEGRNRFTDKEVFASIKSANIEGITFTPNGEYGDAASLEGLTADAVLLGSGIVTARTDVIRNFEVRMWVDSSVVTVTDVDNSTTEVTYTSEEYGNLYYTMRIKITSTKSL